MGTVVTTTQAAPLAQPTLSTVDLNVGNGGTPGPENPNVGSLWACARKTSGDLAVYKSTDGGTTWAEFAAFARLGLQEWSGIWVDDRDWLHIAYRTSETIASVLQDAIFYRRLALAGPNSGQWSAELRVAEDPNGGTPGSVWTGLDIAVRRHPGETWAIVVAGGRIAGSSHGVQLMGVSIDAAGTIYNNTGFLSGTRTWVYFGSGRVTPAVDFEHNGDPRYTATPNLWVSFGRAYVRCVKLTWNGNGWTGPTSSVLLESVAGGSLDAIAGRWDGNSFLVAYSNGSAVRIRDREASNTTGSLRTTPAHPQGNIRAFAINYQSTSAFRVWAVGTSNPDLYYVDFGGSSFGSWTLVSSTDILGTPPAQFSVRRGVNLNSTHDVITAHPGSPNSVVHTAQLLAFPPAAPTWVYGTGTTPAGNGVPMDVAASLRLDWAFSDPDPNDSQTAYALSRQIGAGSLQYWRASDSTWQATEQKNITTTAEVTLTSGQWPGAGGASDAAHTYRVKTWDETDVAGAYSAGLVVVPSAKVNPTITAPTASQVLASAFVNVTWTVAEQTAYDLRLKVASAPAGQYLWTSGKVASTSTSVDIPLALPDSTSWSLELITYNLEGLASSQVTRAFSTDYVEPPAVIPALTPQPAAGVISAVLNSLAAAGTQPAIAESQLWRRPALYTPVTSNPGFEVNTAGWTGVNGTLTRSTAQARAGVAAGRVVPAGATADVYAESANVVIDPTVAYEAEAWIRLDTANKPAKVYIHWYQAGGTYISTSAVTLSAVAGAWQYGKVTATPPANAGRASAAAGAGSTPAAGDAFYVDEIYLRRANPDTGRLVASDVPVGGTVGDWKAAHGTPYEYRALTTGVNGAVVWGPWIA